MDDVDDYNENPKHDEECQQEPLAEFVFQGAAIHFWLAIAVITVPFGKNGTGRTTLRSGL